MTDSIDTSTTFPDSFKCLSTAEIPKLIEDFENNIPDFSIFNRFDDVLNAWLDILEKYTWAIPSDTRFETSDVSLYDHLRSSAAIAACLYKRHIIAIEKGKRLNRTMEFVLIGGDFSGIQDYIFGVTNLGTGGASKRLRARSFFVTLFSDTTIHKILHYLDLPLVCNMFSAGGKFLLLAPNLEETNDMLRRVKEEIEKEIHKTYFNHFSFLMSWKAIKGFKSIFGIYSFFKVADEMFHRLETEKLKKSRNVLLNSDSGLWNTEAFKAGEIYENYKEHGDCKICGRGPAIPEIYDTEKYFEEDEEKNTCFICYRDKFLIGKDLPKINYVAFAKGRLTEEAKTKKIVIYNSRDDDELLEDYYVELLKEQKYSENYYLVYDISRSYRNGNKFTEIQLLNKYYANYVPTDENGNSLCFEDISNLSSWNKEEDGVTKEYGSTLLGILKADIDNLGLIFSKGFDNPRRAEQDLDNLDRKTVSRFLTMGRMIELFFSGWVKDIMSKNNTQLLIDEFSKTEGIDKDRLKKYLRGGQIDFSKIYTVYSGGDDMVLIGPWETMIIFSIFLNMQFRKYTCKNKFITLSAGLNFIKPKYPIASAIKQADSLLNVSKEKGKDRITLFGTTIEWDKLPRLVDFILFLDEKTNDRDSNIKSAFLYRLLEYHRMALSFLEKESKNIEGLKYLSALSYDIGRNIVEWDKNGKLKKGYEEQKELQPLLNEKPDEDSLIFNVKVPLFWTLYRNRRSINDNDAIILRKEDR